MNRSYPSKLLLFGEYAVLAGGEALAIPYPLYNAKWTNQKPSGSKSKQYLISFLSWLQQHDYHKTLNLDLFQQDLNAGLDIESNIPVGYGLGSSGAVVAAVYDKYCISRIDEQNLAELKSMLGGMENFFHGKSSGLDPLVSYLQSPVHITKDKAKLVPENIMKSSKVHMNLIDTRKGRHTAELIERFNEMMGLEHDRAQFENEYLPLVSDCITAYLQNHTAGFKKRLYALSSLQLTLFSFAIPAELYHDWITGLMGNKYYKLCGAGGGGFMICFTLP